MADEARRMNAGWRVGLGLVAIVFLGLGVAYIHLKPVGQAPDEHDHVVYVAWLLDAGSLPWMWMPETGGIGQGDEPPLYYGALAAATRVSGIDLDSPEGISHGYRLARLLTLLLCGLPLVLLTAALARRFRPGDGPFVVLAAALTAFLPMFLHLNTSVGNGRLADTMCAALLLLAVGAAATSGARSEAPGAPSLARHALHGLVIALALLAKLSALPVVAAAGPLFLFSAWRSPRRAMAILALVLPIVALVGPWVAYNLQTYGEPVAFTANMETFFQTGPDSPRGLGLENLPGAWRYFLGVFGFGTPAVGIACYPGPVYGIAFALTVLALIAGPLVGRWRGSVGASPIDPLSPAARWFIAAAILFTAAFYYYTNWRIQHVQSRYLFVVLPLLAGAVAGGALAPFRGRARGAAALVIAALALALSVWGLWLVDPAA